MEENNFTNFIFYILAILFVIFFFLYKNKETKNLHKRCTQNTTGKIIDKKSIFISKAKLDSNYERIYPNSSKHREYIEKYLYTVEYIVNDVSYTLTNKEPYLMEKELGDLLDIKYNPTNPSDGFIDFKDEFYFGSSYKSYRKLTKFLTPFVLLLFLFFMLFLFYQYKKLYN